MLAALHRNLLRAHEEEAQHSDLPELGHREEPDFPPGALAQPQHDERVEQRDVVHREQHGTAARDAFRTDTWDSERESERIAEDTTEPVHPLHRARAAAWQSYEDALLTRS